MRWTINQHVPMRMNLGGSNQPAIKDGHQHNRRHPSSSADPSASITGAPASFNHNGSEDNSNHLQSPLNILNQASNISQLSANNMSFDPAHQLNINEASQEEGSVLTAFSGLAVHTTNASNHTAGGKEIIRRRPSSSSSNGPPMTSSQYRLASSPPLPPQQQVFVQTTATPSPATTIATNSSNAHAPTAVSPPPAMMVHAQQVTSAAAAAPHHQHMVHQQHPVTFHSSSSNMNQPTHSYLQPKPIQNGRIPATKHDNRKLFVGGLPNEVTDYTFLQFFQQYGEVVDSIVLLDRRTKRSRGFGFVTFADESVSDALLNIIPGRTGTVNIMGKNCEIKASEPKTEETYQQPSPHFHQHQQHHHPHHNQPPHQSSQQGGSGGIGNHTPHRLVLSANGAVIHPMTDNQSGASSSQPQQGVNYSGGGEGTEQHQGGGGGIGVPIYSHSTITRTTAGPILAADGSTQDGGTTNVYIQNNYYTLPPGTQLAPSHPLNNTSPTMETLQQREEELMNCGGTVTYTSVTPSTNTSSSGADMHAPFEYPGNMLQPAYPGREVENSGNNIH